MRMLLSFAYSSREAVVVGACSLPKVHCPVALVETATFTNLNTRSQVDGGNLT